MSTISVIIILNILFILLAILYVLLVLYMRRGWLRVPFFQSTSAVHSKVSILIAARNEEENIARTLNCVVGQNYPKELLEVIVIDDHSTDRTAEIVRQYANRGVRLLQLNVGDRMNSYKKYAIAKAIDESEGDIIVTTDADCRMGENWLQTVVQYCEQNDSYLVSSPVVYSEDDTFFKELQTLEFLYLIGLGAAGIGNGAPTTCNGANLAYRKDIFYKMGGFKGIEELASGDDELFLHKVAAQNAYRIGFCKSKDAVVYTDAKPDLKSFISQRRRWASKSTKYKDKKVVVLGVAIWLFNVSLIASLIAFFAAFPDCNWILLTSFVLKISVECVFIQPLTVFANRRDLLKYLPLLSFVHSFYLVYIGLLGNVGKYDWKGRQVK